MLNLPVEFKEKYQRLLGDSQAEAFFEALNKENKKAFRINTLKPNQVSYDLSKKVPEIENAYYGEINGQDPEWVSGTVYSQDPSAMFPAFIASVKEEDHVLDLCAAPGGKSTALAEKLNSSGVLVANEITSSRAKALRENIERWGVKNAVITNESPANLAPHFTQYFDEILVDAPCSGEGMFRKNPEAIKYWSQDYVLTCQERQKEILTEAVKMLKPNGQLIYSTCTFSPEEDEEIVSWLVETYNMKIVPIELPSDKISHGRNEWGSVSGLEYTLRFWPQDGLGEGQFAAILQMPDGKIAKVKKRKIKKGDRSTRRLTKNDQKLVEKVLDNFNLNFDWTAAVVRNDHVFLPAIDKDLKGLKIVNNGLELGIMKKNRFEPSHHLAEVLGELPQEHVIDLENQDNYICYLHGETVRVDSKLKGFVLVSFKGLIFSFGKAANGTLKNFYPKGLRILKK